MKNVVYVLGVLVLGVIGYNLFMKKGDDDSVIEDPIKNSFLQDSPSQKYPMQMPVTPRVDNVNQPWYGGDRSFMGAVSDGAPQFDLTSQSMDYEPSVLWTELKENYN